MGKPSLVSHVKECFEKADKYQSKLEQVILSIDGMSGKKTRHLYNNLVSMEDARYLEIGVWKGSTLCSAMFKNEARCVGVDNWSEFGGPKKFFQERFDLYKGENDATFIESDCWEIDPDTLGKFNIYTYDGEHTEESHYKALSHFFVCLDDKFIFIVDDWNWSNVRDGTMNSIKDNGLSILFRKEIRTTQDNTHAENARKDSDWHNGIAVFVLKKQ